MKDNTNGVSRDKSLNVQEALELSKQAAQSPKTAVGANELKHGDHVEGENGEVGGIIIEKDYEQKKMLNNEKTKKLTSLADMNDKTFNSIKLENNGVDAGAIIINRDPNGEDAMAIKAVKDEFADFVPGPHGLVRRGSKEAQIFQQAMHAVESGQVVLPSVEEYERQKKELEEREAQSNMANETNTPQPVETQPADINMPVEQKVVYQNVEAKPDPILEQLKQQEVKPAPINMAELEAKATNPPVSQVVPKQEVAPAPQVTTFTVDENKVDTFIDTLPPEEKEKVSRSKIIEIREVKKKDLPTNTRRITNLDAYRKVVPHRVSGELVQKVLPNSGYVITIRSCGSLEMADIASDATAENKDWAKRYQFAFNVMVDTSIGKLSFNDFCLRTSPNDIPLIIYGSLEASQADRQTITLTCGGQKCGKDYDFNYSLSQLFDLDNVSDEMKGAIQKIVSSKNTVDTAKETQENAPVMIEKIMDMGNGLTVGLKHPDGLAWIDRSSKLDEIANRYSSLIALFLMYVSRVWVEIPEDENGNKAFTAELVDPYTIAEELQVMTDEQLEVLRQEMQTIESYDVSFSIKGPCQCTHCGFVVERVSCDIDDLVFQRVQKALS